MSHSLTLRLTVLTVQSDRQLLQPIKSVPPGALIVVHANGKRFEDPDVIAGSKSLSASPFGCVTDVAWILQPHIEAITAVGRGVQGDLTVHRRAILRAPNNVDPEAPDLKPTNCHEAALALGLVLRGSSDR